MSKEEEEQLNEIVKKHNVKAIIISTEPLAHFKYAKWAIENSIHLLMDKPITTELDVSTNEKKAKKLYKDYLKLKQLYSPKLKDTVFTLQAQRRYHVGFRKVRSLISEMADKTNCPVTSIQSFHSDGMWRLPSEIVEMNYHPYNQGYGKLSHSGYHSLDISLWFAKAGIKDRKKQYNNHELYTSFVRPIDFFEQINFDDYNKIFPEIPDSFLMNKDGKIMKKVLDNSSVSGEIDAHTIISLKKDDKIITQVGSHLVHNGFSQRGWINSNYGNLYKGNGRLRHESYIIEQGPFQCIVVNAFQSLEISDKLTDPYSVGGEHNFDIHIFRNSSLYKEYKPYELISFDNLQLVEDKGYSRGHQENARRDCIDEFISAILNKTGQIHQESNFLDHELSTFILSEIYRSAAKKFNCKNCVISSKLPDDIWKR